MAVPEKASQRKPERVEGRGWRVELDFFIEEVKEKIRKYEPERYEYEEEQNLGIFF